LNALWSIIFFGLKDIALALICIALLWIAIIAAMQKFRKLSRNAFYLLAPCILWVSFAVILNYSSWILNP